MGLLDTLFQTPESAQALGLLGAHMMAGNAPAGFQAASGLLADAPRRRMKEQLAQMQLEEHRMALEKARRETANEEGLNSLLPQFLSQGRPAMGGTADVNAALPPDFQIGAQAPIAGKAPGFDVRGYTNAAMQQKLMNPLAALKMQQQFAPESRVNKLDVKDFTPASVQKFNTTGNYADLERMDKLHFADQGGSITGLNPFTAKPVGSVPKTGNPFSDLLLADGQGGMRPNSPLIGAKRSIAAAGAPQVNVNTDKSYFGNVAEGMAKNDVALIDAARSAPDRVASAQRVKAILDSNPITGTGAEARLAVHRALSTAGLVDGKDVANTEILASTLANQTLDAIKTSGLGAAQGFTDKDRQFLERAKSGNIEMSAASLRQLADMNERAARATIKRGNAIIGKLRMSPQAGTMGQQLDPIEEPAAPSLVRRPVAPSAPTGAPRFLGFE